MSLSRKSRQILALYTVAYGVHGPYHGVNMNFASGKQVFVKACSNKANMLVQHHPTLLNATCWPRLNTMLDDVGLSLNMLKIFVQHRATLLGQLTMLHDVGFV